MGVIWETCVRNRTQFWGRYCYHVSSALRVGEEFILVQGKSTAGLLKKLSVSSKMWNEKLSQGNVALLTAATSSAPWSKMTYTVKYLEAVWEGSGFEAPCLDTRASNLECVLPKWLIFKKKVEIEGVNWKKHFSDCFIIAKTYYLKSRDIYQRCTEDTRVWQEIKKKT